MFGAVCLVKPRSVTRSFPPQSPNARTRGPIPIHAPALEPEPPATPRRPAGRGSPHWRRPLLRQSRYVLAGLLAAPAVAGAIAALWLWWLGTQGLGIRGVADGLIIGGLTLLDRVPVGTAAIELASVTVIGPSLTLADAYATAAVAMGARALQWLEGLDGYEACWSTPTATSAGPPDSRSRPWSRHQPVPTASAPDPGSPGLPGTPGRSDSGSPGLALGCGCRSGPDLPKL